MWNHTLTELIKDNISIPVPTLIGEWKEDLKKVHYITVTHLATLLIQLLLTGRKLAF